MDDEELQSEFARIVGYFTGVTTALTQVIRGLQAQAGYDHQAFLAHLAVYQVVGEQTESKAPEGANSAYQETLAFFAKATEQAPSLASKLGRSRED
jgi:hypothetical protein